jgi:hypothetical protein
VRAAGLTLVQAQPSLGLAVVEGPAGAPAVLRGLPGVVSVARDYTVHPQTLGFDYTTQQGSLTNITQWVGAKNMWKAGYTGNGIDVALLDTGVTPIPALAASSKVVVGPDLSFESQTADARYLDSFGHGTVMGSIIAGRETPKSNGTTYANDTTNFYGMAPDARLVSVKLGDRYGAVDVSQMVAGIDWVVANRYRAGGNIRVINISYGARSALNAQDDPLSWAAEAAWKSGIVVVASSGNDGETSVGLASPAYNPWVIAVGATDNKGTSTAGDDSVATFSNTGNGVSRAPDLLAPGVGVIAPIPAGSQIAQQFPGARMGYGFIRGSGTSQAAAEVSGAVALILSKYPNLTPDEIKRFLARSASTIPNVPTSMQGKGSLQLNKILTDTPPLRLRGPRGQRQRPGLAGRGPRRQLRDDQRHAAARRGRHHGPAVELGHHGDGRREHDGLDHGRHVQRRVLDRRRPDERHHVVGRAELGRPDLAGPQLGLEQLGGPQLGHRTVVVVRLELGHLDQPGGESRAGRAPRGPAEAGLAPPAGARAKSAGPGARLLLGRGDAAPRAGSVGWGRERDACAGGRRAAGAGCLLEKQVTVPAPIRSRSTRCARRATRPPAATR